MSSTWASVVPAGTVPKDYPRHFDGLSGRPRASVSRRSPRSRAHRGHRAGFVEVGSGGDQGQHIEVSAGVVAIVGAASRAGRERLRGSSPPRSTGGRDGGRGETVRGCVTWGERVPPFSTEPLTKPVFVSGSWASLHYPPA